MAEESNSFQRQINTKIEKFWTWTDQPEPKKSIKNDLSLTDLSQIQQRSQQPSLNQTTSNQTLIILQQRTKKTKR